MEILETENNALIFVSCMNSWLLFTCHWRLIKRHLFLFPFQSHFRGFRLVTKHVYYVHHGVSSVFISAASNRRISVKFGAYSRLQYQKYIFLV
jgi:hypothetical protein